MTGPKRRPPRLGWLYHVMFGFLGLFDRWLRLSCRAFATLASARLERPLRWGEQVSHRLHRGMCHLCRLHEQRLEQVHRLALEVGRAERDLDLDRREPHEELGPEARDRMRAAIRAARRGDEVD